MADPDKTPPLEENLKKALVELLLLFLLARKNSYIGELTDMIRDYSCGVLSVVSPYGAIYRLLQSGYIIEKEKCNAPDGRRRQYFQITDSGRIYLNQLLDIYNRFTTGVANVLAKGEEIT